MTIDQFNQQYGHDPQYIALMQAAEADEQKYGAAAAAIINGPVQKMQQFVKSKGVDIHNTLSRPTADGGYEMYQTHPGQDFLKDAAITGGIALGGAAAIGALGGGAAASAPELASMLPGAEGGAAESFMAGVAPAAASTGFGAALKSALPAIIGGGAQLGGAAIAAHGNTEAAKIAAAEQDKALAQAKAIYDANVARQKPFVDLGASALGPLATGLGLPTPAPTAPPAPATNQPVPASGFTYAPGGPNAGVNVPSASMSLSQIGQSSSPSGSLVRMQNPATGLVHLVPQSDVPALQQAGGVLV